MLGLDLPEWMKRNGSKNVYHLQGFKGLAIRLIYLWFEPEPWARDVEEWTCVECGALIYKVEKITQTLNSHERSRFYDLGGRIYSEVLNENCPERNRLKSIHCINLLAGLMYSSTQLKLCSLISLTRFLFHNRSNGNKNQKYLANRVKYLTRTVTSGW